MRRIEPGKDPALAPDEGLVVLVVDTSAPISSIHVRAVGGGTAEVLNYLDNGRNLYLYAAKAGEYTWSQVNVLGWSTRTRFELKDQQYRFRVEPGALSYSGDLVLRPSSWTRLYVHVANRSLPVLDWLDSQHGAIQRRMPLVYRGDYPDPFPDFYRVARGNDTRSATDLNAGREPPKPTAPLALSAETLWKPGKVVSVSINSSGDLLALAVRYDNGNYGVELIDLAAGFVQRLDVSKFANDVLLWKDARTLIASSGDQHRSHVLYRIGMASGDQHAITRLPISGIGQVVDLLPNDPRAILFEGFDRRGELMVHRLVLEGDRYITGFQNSARRDRLNVGVSQDMGWYADGEGRLRLALAVRDDAYVLMHGRDGVFKEVLRSTEQERFQPSGLSYDGETIYGFTDEGRTQRDLVAFSPASGKVERTLFTKPGVDMVAAVFDERREPVGVRYYQSGQLVTEYFDAAEREREQWLRGAFPGRTVSVIDRSRDGKQLILWVDGSDRPAQIYHMDVVAKRASLIEETAPWLANTAFAPVHLLQAKGSDGLPIEAFLTLPKGEGRRPLIVFPHGGPIGVADRLHFNREVQFLASQGYAVLQVNFRGSEGYGKAFREAGHRNYGRLIEDDIDAALRAALAQYPLDAQRMCAVGSSYGGYSALVSAIRWPGRFRCVVSISGLSDRALFFTASDSVRSSDARPELERIMGNPRTDLAEMQATSPLYHVKDLQVPVMLVHGREDLRVDFEHTRRLVRLLNLDGRAPVVLAFPGMGHGFDDLTITDIAWTGIAGFLQQHLSTATSVAASPAAAPDAKPAPPPSSPSTGGR